MRIILIFALIWCSTSAVTAQVPAPTDVISQYKQQFTPHHRLVDYFTQVATMSDRVHLIEYGRTPEDRPLLLAIVSTAENIQNLEAIRVYHQQVVHGQAAPAADKVIVWLNYTVHGNEPSGAEASMQVLYNLVTAQDRDIEAQLSNAIIIIDPVQNPDGYDRYSHWYRGVSQQQPNAWAATREHHEPWPTGRVNHYYFDLNRDWAWGIQPETRQRLVHYQQWLPHVVPDIHEQYPENPYYFAPAAEPFHEAITDWQRTFQTDMGRAHAKIFDANGWAYFTKEVFDLLYPSYGDTYPTFNGAIGMTYEQAGHGVAGRAYALTQSGDTLTLATRISHHQATSMSTIRYSLSEREDLTRQMEAYFHKARQGEGLKYKTFVIKQDQPSWPKLKSILDMHRIKYAQAAGSHKASGYVYQSFQKGSFQVRDGDIVIPTRQSQGLLAHVLLEPKPFIADSLTYDITAWSLLYAHGLEALATAQHIPTNSYQEAPAKPQSTVAINDPYIIWSIGNDYEGYRLAANLSEQGYTIRMAKKAFTQVGKRFPQGSFVMSRADNANKWPNTNLLRVINKAGVTSAVSSATGWATDGPDMGSEHFVIWNKSQVGAVYDDQISAQSYGQIWSFFEQDLELPFQPVPLDGLSAEILQELSVLVLTDISDKLEPKTLTLIKNWVQAGGRLIVIGQAIKAVQDDEAFHMDANKPDKETTETPDPEWIKYGQQSNHDISNFVPGGIIKCHVDNSHPLAIGLPEAYASLRMDDLFYKSNDNLTVVIKADDSGEVCGFFGANKKPLIAESLVLATESMGQGDIVYFVDNPLFRGFWEAGKSLFAKALYGSW